VEEEESITVKVQRNPHIVIRRIPARLNGLRMATAGSYTLKAWMVTVARAFSIVKPQTWVAGLISAIGLKLNPK